MSNNSKALSYSSVLFILTNIDCMKNGNQKPTGTTIGSLAHAYQVFKHQGYRIVFASCNGGHCPIDKHSIDHHSDDPVCASFLRDRALMTELDNSMKLSNLLSGESGDQFRMVYVPGGIGQLWDVARSNAVSEVISRLYEDQGAVIGTVGHGLSALLHVKLRNGRYLLEGKTVTGFTDEEEKESATMENVPMSLEEQANGIGAQFVHEGAWGHCVQCCDRIITAQNQKSAQEVAEKMCSSHQAKQTSRAVNS